MKKVQFHKNILYLAELLILMILLFMGGFGKEVNVVDVTGAVIFEELSEGHTQNLWRKNDLNLKPGVYRITVDAEIPAGAALSVAVQSSEVKVYGELLANEMKMEAGQTRLSSEITVTSGTDAYLQILLSGDLTEIQINRVSLCRTSRMYFVAAVCFFVVITVVKLLLDFRAQILSGRVSLQQQIIVWAGCATVLIAVFPYLGNYITGSGDTYVYLNRIEAVKNALRAGELTGDGAWDLFLLFPAILRRVGFTIQTSYRCFIFAIMIATELTAYFAIKRCVKEGYVALLGAGMYLLSPYHIDIVYNQGAVLDGVWMIFLPLAVCGVWRLFAKDISVMTAFLAGCCIWLPAVVCLFWERKSGLLKGVVSFVVVLLVCVILERMKNGADRNRLLRFAGMLLAGASVYWVNDLAYYKNPVYVYNLNGAVAEVICTESGLTVAGNVISLCTVLGLLLLYGYRILQKHKGGNVNG